MYIVIAICVTIALILWFVVSLLSKREKLGKFENENKLDKIFDETMEIIRKTKAHSDTLTREQRDERLCKHTNT
jgi:hypothetical protein